MYHNDFVEENQDDFDALYGDDSLTSTAPDKKKKSRRARSVAPSDSARSWADRTAPWQGNAKPLAEWTIKHLVNRTDVWGAYLPLDRRLGGRKATTKPSRATREIVLLTTQVLQTHFECQNVGDVVGLHSISVDGTCRWIAWDIDRHDDGKEAPSVESNLRRAIGIHDRLISLGMKPLLIESNGDGGYHCWLVLDQPVTAEEAHRFAKRILEETGGGKVETFPKQAQLKQGKIGNFLRLPGRHHTREFVSRVYDGEIWLDGQPAIDRILATDGDDSERVISYNCQSPAQKSVESSTSHSNCEASTPLGRWLSDIVAHIPDGEFESYDTWLRTGLAIHHELPTGEGLEIWNNASKRVPEKFEEGACETAWSSFDADSSDPVTVGSLIHMIQAVEPEYKTPPRPDAGSTADVVEIKTWQQMIFDNPNPQYRPVVIDGYLREGELMNLVGGVKIGKSWMSMQIGLAVASGTPWLGTSVAQGRVLLVDRELAKETLQVRLSAVAEAMHIAPAGCCESLSVAATRGTPYTLRDLEKSLRQYPPGHFKLIVLDPLYRFMAPEQSEASDQGLRVLYEQLAAIAHQANAAIVVVHHTTKGPQSKKSTTDIGSGHGVISRSPDTHVTLLAIDETQDHVTQARLTAVTRSFPPPPPKLLHKTPTGAPVWHVESSVGQGDQRAIAEAQDVEEARRFADQCATDSAESRAIITARHRQFVTSNGKPSSKAYASLLFEKALNAGYIAKVPGPDNRSFRYRRTPKSMRVQVPVDCDSGEEFPERARRTRKKRKKCKR